LDLQRAGAVFVNALSTTYLSYQASLVVSKALASLLRGRTAGLCEDLQLAPEPHSIPLPARVCAIVNRS
jgi:hypothetical protein